MTVNLKVTRRYWSNYFTIEGPAMNWKSITDADGNCFCLRDESLSGYVIYYHDPGHAITAPADFMKRYAAWVSSVDAMIDGVGIISKRHIKAFTISDAFNLVAWEFGDEERKPRHRVIGENGFELAPCSHITPEAQKTMVKEILERLHARQKIS